LESSVQMENSTIYNESDSNLNADSISSNSSSNNSNNSNSTQSTSSVDVSGAARQLSLDQDSILEYGAASTPRVVSAQRNRRSVDISESAFYMFEQLINLGPLYRYLQASQLNS